MAGSYHIDYVVVNAFVDCVRGWLFHRPRVATVVLRDEKDRYNAGPEGRGFTGCGKTAPVPNHPGA